MEKVHSAYGPWLAYMMDVKRVSTEKLAKKSGISTQVIDDLLHSRIPPEKAKDAVMKLGEIMITEDGKEAMNRVMQALDIHTDLRNWSASCDGGCCAWNLVTEISFDEALDPFRKKQPIRNQ